MADARTDFFVSYTGVDQEWAEWIAHVLEDAEYTTIVQSWDFRPGGNFVVEMQRALQTSDRLIAVLSPDYLSASFTEAEWVAIFAQDPQGRARRLVPVMVRECQPEGLLSPVIQIRIHDLQHDEDAAKRKLLDGVRAGRGKPATPPRFPGSTAALPPTGSKPTALDGGVALCWHPQPTPPAAITRAALEGRLPYHSGLPAVELHLVPLSDDARLQMLALTESADILARYGRENRFFSAAEALNIKSDHSRVSVVANSRGAFSGLAVTRSGQRSAWISLPHDFLGSVLDESHLVAQLSQMLDLLIGLKLPTPGQVIPVVAVEPAMGVTLGQVAAMPRSSATTALNMPAQLVPSADESIDFAAIAQYKDEIAAELAARLLAEIPKR